MTEYFPKFTKIKYEGSDSKNPLVFKHYNPKRKIMDKTMAQHLILRYAQNDIGISNRFCKRL